MNKSERSSLLSEWIKPSSLSEQDRQDRAERMIREAIDAHAPILQADYRVYVKGSYANNTNVRLDSDVDIVVECHDCFYFDYGPGVVAQPGLSSPYTGPWTHERWRTEVQAALVKKFGVASVDVSGAVAAVVSEIPGSRPSADVVPSFQFRRFWASDRSRYAEGSAVFTTAGKRIVNWPHQQLENGRAKNDATGRRYKNLVRALKNAENYLVELNQMVEKPSYFMECLVWNVPEATLSEGALDDAFRDSLLWIWGRLTTGYCREDWLEPNKMKYMFGAEQKWTEEDAKELVKKVWNALGYGN